MFRATTNPQDHFGEWIKDSKFFPELNGESQSLVRRAFAHGWNSCFKSVAPKNSQSDDATLLGQETNQVLADFKSEPDRSVAIVGMAFIEEGLNIAVASAFVDDETARKIVESTMYSRKCELAFCLGFFGKESLSDLKLLGEIRNKFAHRRSARSFTDADIRKKCDELKMFNHIQGWTETDPRLRFTTAVALVSFTLNHRARGEPQKCPWGQIWESL